MIHNHDGPRQGSDMIVQSSCVLVTAIKVCVITVPFSHTCAAILWIACVVTPLSVMSSNCCDAQLCF